MGALLAIVYVIGVFGSVMVGRSRAGLTQLGRLSLGTALGSLPWFGHQMASMFAWPVFLAVWLYRGRPESPWESFYSPSTGGLRVRRRPEYAASPGQGSFRI